MTVYWPNGELTRPRVSSDYDAARRNPVTGIVQPHNGIDLVGWTDNKSPVDGTVVFAGYNGAAGNEVRIRADGPTAFHVGDYYRILHNASLYVRTGERVSARQPVGRMGTTGQSTGVHCHYETHEGGLWRYVNPTDYMNRANAGTPAGGGATPFPKGPFDMLSDFQQQQMYDALVAHSPQGDYYKTDAAINDNRANTGAVLTAIGGIASGGILFPGAPYNAFVAMVNAVRAERDEAPIDEEALAVALGPVVAPLLLAQAGTLNDATLDALVDRLLDEQAKRLAS